MDDIRKGNCPICRHHEIIEAVAMDLSPRAGWPQSEIVAYAGAVTIKFNANGTFEHHGVIYRYVCRRCGYLQRFAKDADQIPIGDDYRQAEGRTTACPLPYARASSQAYAVRPQARRARHPAVGPTRVELTFSSL